MITQHFAIGDVQGCLKELKALLKHIQFQPTEHQLWFCGDLINRGPDSLGVINFIRDLPIDPIVVLGNHDLHFLAVHHGAVPIKDKDTFKDILDSTLSDEICQWYLQRPLAYYDRDLGFCMVHAGVAPPWSIDALLQYTAEVEAILQTTHARLNFFNNMYGNKPTVWSSELNGDDRLRLITNYCTRMRYCDRTGAIDLKCKVPPGYQPEHLMPWFKVPNRVAKDNKIIFGHWASLWGKAQTANIYALDTGCVWGGELTALRLEDEARFSVPAF